jgi:hypothetical protein
MALGDGLKLFSLTSRSVAAARIVMSDIESAGVPVEILSARAASTLTHILRNLLGERWISF